MVLQDLFDTLATGEFSNLAIGNSVTGSIKETAYPKVVNAINRSLREVYKRFLLKKKKVRIQQQIGVTRYYLRSGNSYLVDHPTEAFQDDVIRILKIKDVTGITVALNPPRTWEDQTYFRTAAYDSLDLTTPKEDQEFTLEYQASYPKIELPEIFDPKTYQLHYPSFIEEALTNYIASLLVRGKTTKSSEGEGYTTNTWRHKYELACAEIISLGLAEEATEEDTRFNNRGFV